MSKYDEERKKILDRMQSNNVSFTPPSTSKYASERSSGKSKYDEERQALYNPVETTLPPGFVPGVGAGILDTQKHIDDFANRSQPQPIAPEAPKKTNAKLPGRNLPVIGPILRGADVVADTLKPVSNFLGEFYTPGAGLGTVAKFTGGVGEAVSKLAPKIGLGTGLGAKVAREAIKEGVTGVPLGTGQSLSNNPNDFGEAVKQGAFGGALGAVGGAAAPALGKALTTLFRRNSIPEQHVQEVLALPLGRGDARAGAARARGVNALGTEPVVNPHTFALPEGQMPRRIDVTPQPAEPLGLPSPRLEQPTAGRLSQQVNPYRTQFESLIDRAKQLEAEGKLTPGREDEDLRSLWSQMAGKYAPSLDELINLAYKPRPNRVNPGLVNQARQTQYSREVAGAPLPVKSASDRYPQGVMGNVDAPITVPKGVPQERYGVFGEAASPQTAPARAPGTPARQPEVLNADVAPARPRLDVTPVQEADEIVQAVNHPRVRDRVYSALDQAEKAARERIAKRGNRLSANPIDEWGDHAVIMAAKLGKGTIKAADFTEALVKEFGENIRPHAERIFRQSKELLRQQERRASKEGQDAQTFNNGPGDVSTFDAKISRTSAKKKTPFSQRWEKIRTQFVDDLAPLEGLEKRVRGSLASAEDSLYKAARMFKGTPEKANQIVKTRLAPVIDAVEKAGYSGDDIGRYALAVHAKDVNAAGYKSGFTNAEIDDVLSKYGTPEMEAARKELIQINKDMMKELVDSGVVSGELAKTLDERWKNYIPLFRAFDDQKVDFSGGLSGALANVASPIKGLKGSERAVVDPLENMVKNIFQSVNAAERNKVAGQLAKLAESDPEGAFIRKLGPNEEVGRKNVVNVKVNGENVKYEVEPEVYKAMLNMDQESSSMLVNILSKPASLLRAGATLTPEFSLRNPMRDVLQAFVTSESGFNPITDFGAGLIQSISKGRLYQDWIDNLGAYGNIISQDRDVHRQALEKVLKQPASKQFVNIVTGKSLIRLLRAISDTTESATKVGEYRAALRQGQSKQEAAYRSRDLMDFARAGTSVRQTNKVVAFLNANIQGKSKLVRAIKQNPPGTIARMFTAVTVPTIGIYASNHYYANDVQKETIADAPDWQKDAFWLMAVPGTDVVARIPKPFDLAPIFANLPEKAMEYIIDNDPAAFDGFVRRTIKNAALPMQISGLLPFVEGMANYSFFREGDIIPMREQRLEAKDQYDPIRTTETAKLLAAGADKLTGGKGGFKNFSSPRIMDNTIKGLTAGLGTYATSAIDTILTKTGVVDRPVAPEKRLEQRPLAKAFLVDSMQGGDPMDKFYTNLEKLNKEKASASINEKEFTQEPLRKYLDNVSGVMSDINKEIRNIEKSDLSAKEKRNQIDPLVKERNQLAKDAVVQGGLK